MSVTRALAASRIFNPGDDRDLYYLWRARLCRKQCHYNIIIVFLFNTVIQPPFWGQTGSEKGTRKNIVVLLTTKSYPHAYANDLARGHPAPHTKIQKSRFFPKAYYDAAACCHQPPHSGICQTGSGKGISKTIVCAVNVFVLMLKFCGGHPEHHKLSHPYTSSHAMRSHSHNCTFSGAQSKLIANALQGFRTF